MVRALALSTLCIFCFMQNMRMDRMDAQDDAACRQQSRMSYDACRQVRAQYHGADAQQQQTDMYRAQRSQCLLAGTCR